MLFLVVHRPLKIMKRRSQKEKINLHRLFGSSLHPKLSKTSELLQLHSSMPITILALMLITILNAGLRMSKTANFDYQLPGKPLCRCLKQPITISYRQDIIGNHLDSVMTRMKRKKLLGVYVAHLSVAHQVVTAATVTEKEPQRALDQNFQIALETQKMRMMKGTMTAGKAEIKAHPPATPGDAVVIGANITMMMMMMMIMTMMATITAQQRPPQGAARIITAIRTKNTTM
jgi:hypothetical protein